MQFQDFANLIRLLAGQGKTSFQQFQPHSDTYFATLVNTDPGRNHVVLVAGGSMGGNDEFAICVALGIKLPKGQELNAEMGMDLLRRNAGLGIGSWCIKDYEGDTWVALRDVFTLKDVDPTWACARIQSLANTADAFESELGRDEY